MKHLFEQLEELVSQKTVHYGQLIDLMNEEWRYIGGNHVEKLETLLEKKRLLLDTIQQLNLKREQVVREIAGIHGLEPHQISLKDIIRIKDNHRAQRLAHYRRLLRSQIDTINRMNQTNRKLVRQSSRTVKDSIEFLVQPTGNHSPYSSRGNLDDVPLEGRMVSTSA